MFKNKRIILQRVALIVVPMVFFGCYQNTLSAQSYTQDQSQKKPSEVVKKLQELTQYEIDGSFLLSQCIDNLKSQDLKTKLLPMKNDCETMISDLAAFVTKYGGTVPEYSKDFKGYFMNGYTAVRGAITDKGTLNALHTNLDFILKAFKKAANKNEFPSDVNDALKKMIEKKERSLQDLQAEINKL
jgi:uncharacterized protein (TIGR02284 family)